MTEKKGGMHLWRMHLNNVYSLWWRKRRGGQCVDCRYGGLIGGAVQVYLTFRHNTNFLFWCEYFHFEVHKIAREVFLIFFS